MCYLIKNYIHVSFRRSPKTRININTMCHSKKRLNLFTEFYISLENKTFINKGHNAKIIVSSEIEREKVCNFHKFFYVR